MRLARDHSAGAYAVSVQCIECLAMLRLADCIMDLDGPSFRAYYHAECLIRCRPDTVLLDEAIQAIQHAHCHEDGCTRCSRLGVR